MPNPSRRYQVLADLERATGRLFRGSRFIREQTELGDEFDVLAFVGGYSFIATPKAADVAGIRTVSQLLTFLDCEETGD